MPVNTAITIRKGTASQWSSTNPVLASGEPGYDLSNNILKIGDGVSNWNSLSNHKHSSIDITNFNSSVSGVLDSSLSTSLVGGTGIVLNYNSVNDTLVINASGLQPSGNYSVVGHSHGNINSSGQIGSVASRVITTSDNGLLVAETDVQFECASIFIGTGGDFITNGGMVLAPEAIIFSDNTVQETAYTGKIGSTSGLLVVTTTDGALTSSSGRSLNTITNSVTAGTIPQTDYIYVATVPNITVTMPSAIGNNNRYTIKNLSNGTVNVAPPPGQTIDNQYHISIVNQYISIDLVSDNQNWIII
jgi:hypothetical protein